MNADPLLGARRSEFTGGFRCTLVFYILLLLFWTVCAVGYYIYVSDSHVFTQSSASLCSGGVDVITTANVPFYSYPVSPALNPSISELYCSFDYYIWASDYLLVLVPVYVLAVALLAVVNNSRSPFCVTCVGIVVFLIELAKAIYWTLYWTNVLPCDEFQFCINRDPGGDPSSANMQFIIAVIMTYLFSLMSLTLLYFGGTFRRAKYSSGFAAKMEARLEAEPAGRAMSEGRARQSGNALRRLMRPSPSPARARLPVGPAYPRVEKI